MIAASWMTHCCLGNNCDRATSATKRLQRELASLRASVEQVVQGQQTLHHDYETLVDATRTITGERDLLRQRVAELEAANRRLVDMLWGRRSERRSESADQQHLHFGDEPVDSPSAQEQEIITAQDQADEACDRELLKRLEARRKARREKQQQQGREEFPPSIERRERVIDLPEEQKQGLKLIGVKLERTAAVREAARVCGSDQAAAICGAGQARRKACEACRRRWRSWRAANTTSA